MTQTTDIRYRPDGSIDTAFYLQRAHRLRSEKAHRLLGTPAPETPRPSQPRRWFFRLPVLART